MENLEPRLALTGDVIISEFLASNSTNLLDGDDRSSDWIELNNTTPDPIDLTGWHLTDNENQPSKWPLPNQTLNGGEYLLVFASGQSTQTYVDPQGFAHTNFKLGADGEYLALRDSEGNIATEFAPEYPRQTTDISYGFDQQQQPVYFTNPTPAAANDEASADRTDVQISEIMYHPASRLDTDEYLEIYNNDTTPFQLNNWSLRGGVDFDFPNVTLLPGEYLVVAADTDAFQITYPGVSNVVGNWSGTLANSTEQVRLVNDRGVTIDEVTYADAGQWADRERGPDDRGHQGWVWSGAHDGGGSSLELVNPFLPNNHGQNWAASAQAGGTPGNVNSVSDADNDSAPLLVNVQHQPAIPSSTDDVVITARLIDEDFDGVSANLIWRVDGGNFTTAGMNNLGLESDLSANDNIFSGSIPAQPDETVVEWFVMALDAAGNSRTFPAAPLPDGIQQTNLLYQVDDSFDPNQVIDGDDMPVYRLIMTEAERAELELIGSGFPAARSDAQMNGTFIAVTEDGVDVRYNVGLRNRGNGSRDDFPNNIRVNIPSDTPWLGIDQFNLNTESTQMQLAGQRLYAAAGLVSEDAKPILVQVNGQNLAEGSNRAHGVYIQIEATNSHFAENHFPDDDNGNLYRGSHLVFPTGDLAYLGDDPADYERPYAKQTNQSENDYTDLIHLIETLNLTSDENYFTEVNKVVDVDQWLGYFSLIAMLGTRETVLGTGRGDDYFIYIGENDPRAVLIPHDFDAILGGGESFGSPTSSIHLATQLPTVSRFLTHPDIAPRYHQQLLELTETIFAKEPFDQLIDELLTPFAPAEEIESIKSFMDVRRIFVSDFVTQQISISTGLPTTADLPRTTQNLAGLVGTAPLASTRSVTVAGELAEHDPFTGVWSVGEVSLGGETIFVAESHVWHFLDGGNEPDSAIDWTINDPGWADSGPAPLGYHDGDIQTEVAYIDTDPATEGTQKNITTYLRTTFQVEDPTVYTSLQLDLRRDDGAIVMLNGTEIVRSNLPEGSIDSTTPALTSVGGSEENQFFQFAIDPSLLIEGVNVLAVEMHQRTPTSSDLIFDMRLRGEIGTTVSQSGISLNPGINRIEVNAYDGPNGTGNQLDSQSVDIWFDNATTTPVDSDIESDVTWSAANSPYVIESDVTISNGTLTIEPGVTVFVDPDVDITIVGNGQIFAEGTPAERIRFSHNPLQGTANWGGLNIVDTDSDNLFRFVDFQRGDANGQAVDISYGRATFDHVSWFDIDNQVIDMVHPTVVVSNSHIPGIGGDETIHLVGLDVGEQLVFENNIFGKNTSGGDVIDMAPDSTNRQTIYFRNNTFLGGLDDGIDTDGNIVVFENNTFYDFHLGTSRTTTSNAISSGHQNVGDVRLSSELTIRNNTFYDVDHALLLKDFSYARFENNTVVNATVGGIQFQELAGSNVVGPGLGADLDSNIFWETPLVFEAIHEDTQLTYDRNIVTADLVGAGVGNISADPLLADPSSGDFRLTEHSPARFSGADGTDMGAVQTPGFTPASASNLQITELHYHPLPGRSAAPFNEVPADGDLFEFIELFNFSDETIDLSNTAFVDGVTFDVPWGTQLAAGERVVVVKDVDIFESRYGTEVPILGEYSGNLDNGGELVRLGTGDGTVIVSIEYGDQNVDGWPAAADGNGPSLEFAIPGELLTDYSIPGTWQNGARNGGTPGIANIDSLPCDLVDVADGCNIHDLDALYQSLDGTPSPLTDALIRDWLTEASDPSNPSKQDTNHTYAFGDLNLDGQVDSTDLGRLLNNFGTDATLWGDGNLNGDSTIDSADLGLLLNNFGFRSPTPDATSAVAIALETSQNNANEFNSPFSVEVDLEEEEEEEEEEV